MAAIDFQVTYSTADGIEHKLLCSSFDRKVVVDEFADRNNNNVKNSFMPWQCQDTQDDERSLRIEISNTLISMNSTVCKGNLDQSDKHDLLNSEAPIDLNNRSPIDKDFINKLMTDKKKLNTNINYNCPLCGYKCLYEPMYTNHLLSHGIENAAQMENLKPVHPLDKHKCSKCKYITTNKAMYNKHIIKSGHNTLSCPECREKFGSTYDLHKHKLTHALGSEFACPLCEYKGQKLIELKKHLLKHSEKRLFNCPKCEFASSKIYILEKHILSHTEKDEIVNVKINVKCGRKIRTNIIQGYNREHLKALYLFEY